MFSETNMSKCDIVVYIKNLCKSYDNISPILQNICMNVKRGTIHCLMGASGCGKTSLLSCIVGTETWESGELLIFGKNLKRTGDGMPRQKFGYMPQELALYRHLTIREIIQFYGQLNNMTNSEITEMWDFLCQLLDLPVSSTLIGNLSGGEKRRASISLAMLHSPELLVLDEPTAGVDPLLRKKIWDYLYKLVKSTGATVLLTTHYIEEARHADTIGVMRNGRLLTEDSPSNVVSLYNCHLLQEAVLYICQQDDKKFNEMSPNHIFNNSSTASHLKVKYSLPWKEKLALFSSTITRRESQQSDSGLFRQNSEFDEFAPCDNGAQLNENRINYCGTMKQQVPTGLRKFAFVQTWHKIIGLTKVMLFTYARHPVFLLLILLLPIFQSTLGLLTTGSKPRDLHMGVVNHELVNWSVECSLPSHFHNSCNLSFLSCQYLNQLRNGDLLILDPHTTELQARAEVYLGKSFGYIVFPKTFSESSVDLAISRLFVLNETILGSRIHVHLDYSELIQISLILKHLYMTYIGFVRSVAKSCEFNGELTTALDFRPPVYGPDEDDFSGFVLPGGVTISVFGISFILTAISHVSDRKEGNIIRAKSAGLSTIDIICSHLLTQAVVAIPQLIIWNVMLRIVYDFVILGPLWLWIIFIFLVEMNGAFFGLLLGQVLANETHVLHIIIFMYTVFIFFGCAFLPVQWIKNSMQSFALIIPTYLPNESMRSIVVRGAGITHPTVWPGLVSIAIWVGFLSIILMIVFRYC